MIRVSFNRDWFFRKEGAGQPVTAPITLPHDAMLLEQRSPRTANSYHTGYFPGGIYRYTKTFFAPADWRGKQVLLEFEGVYRNSEVFLNGQLAGGRPYGYSNFYIALERFLHINQDNTVEVVVHNDKCPNSRWYTGSGIYRNVKLLVGGPLRILPDGVRITTKSLHDQQALVEVETQLVNDGHEARAARLLTTVHGPGGAIGAAESAVTVGAGKTAAVHQNFTVQNPALWSLDHPNLYGCSVKVLDGDTILDEDRETFGIRVIEVDAKNGFRLNGEPVKLRGGCVHHDNGVIGACTLEAAEDRRVRIMKESGFNAIRSAHNPMSKAMLEACDRRGMLVMDEFSDVWLRSKTAFDYSLDFEEWWERDIQAMVEKDYNHPCVVMYSIGNEIKETALPEGVEYNRKLAEKVRSLDPTRFVTNSINGFHSIMTSLRPKANRKAPLKDSHQSGLNALKMASGTTINLAMNFANQFMDTIVSLPLVDRGTRDAFAAVDVAGYNYMAGRYKRDGKRYPGRVICGSESFPPEIAKNWRLVKRLPHVIGDFSWAGWDYLGEAGLCSWQYGRHQPLYKPYPCILADSSIIDITGHRQAQSYLHEIVWGLRKEPYIAVRLVNHAGEPLSKTVWRGTNAIASWSWDGCEGRPALIEVYADAESVELFLNGRSLGRKPAGDARDYKAIFQTTYQPGELTAVAYASSGQEIGRTSLRSAGPELRLLAQAETKPLKADGEDLAFIDILLADENGIVKPLADRKVTVLVEGAGALFGFGSANPLTGETFTDGEHITYQGRALAVVRAGLEPGTVTVTVSAPGCANQVLTISVEPAGQR